MKKRHLLLIALALIGHAPAHANSLALAPQQGTISVIGHAQIEKNPDRVFMTFVIEHKDDKVSNAKKLVDDRSSEVLQFLEKSGLKKGSIAAETWNIRPHSEYDPNTRKQIPMGYIVQRTFNISFPTTISFPNIMDGLISLGVSQLNNIRFGFSDYDELKLRCLKQALLNSKLKASQMLDGLDCVVEKPLAIHEQGTSQPAPNHLLRQSLQEQSGGFSPGDQKIEASIEVVYSIQPKP